MNDSYLFWEQTSTVPSSLSRIQHPTDGDKQEGDGGSKISVNSEDGLQWMTDACHRQSSRQVILIGESDGKEIKCLLLPNGHCLNHDHL